MKLIRDKIPDIIKSKGETCNTWSDKENLLLHLLLKFKEEKDEFLDAVDEEILDHIYEEGIDVLEVIISIIRYYSKEEHTDIMDKMNYLMLKKRMERGGFDKAIILE